MEQQRIALITGASGGIGAAIARRLTEDHFTVILSGSNLEKLNHLASGLENAHPLPCDLSNRDERSKLVEKAVELGKGRLDVIVNNAGITRDNLLMRMDNDSWDRVIDVNLTANFEICRAAVKVMMKQRYGRIILISSVTASSGNAGQANYTASKAGLEAMAKTLAQEIAGRGITVNSIAPGFIETPMTDKLPDTVKQGILEQIPIKRMGTPEDIAYGVGFLASPMASYITGETLHINGGLLMQ